MRTSIQDLCFPVEKAKIFDKTGFDSISTTEYGIFATVGNKQILLSTCSSNYELLPNANLFPKIEVILKNGNIDFDVEYKMIDHSRFYAEYTLKTGAITVGGSKDKMAPVLRIEHSYNGLLKYKMTFGYFRFICGNGLVVPVEGKEAENIHVVGKHTAKILQSLEQLIEKIQFFTRNQKKYAKNFEVIADRWVEDWATRIEEVAFVSGVGKRGIEQITERITFEADELNDGKVNDWLIYNAFNYHIFNATTSEGKEYATAPHLRYESDRKVLNTLLKFEGNALTKEVKKKKKLEAIEA